MNNRKKFGIIGVVVLAIIVLGFIFTNNGLEKKAKANVISPSAPTEQLVTPDTLSSQKQPTTTETQIIEATYDTQNLIQPKNFTVKVGLPVRFELTPKEDGSGCMGSVMIPGFANTPQFMVKGKLIVFEFTPEKIGSIPITCAMGQPFGTITVN